MANPKYNAARRGWWSAGKMVFSAPPAAKRPKLGNVAIDSEGKTMGQYRQDARDQNAEHKHSLKYGFLSDIMDQAGRRPEEKEYALTIFIFTSPHPRTQAPHANTGTTTAGCTCPSRRSRR